MKEIKNYVIDTLYFVHIRTHSRVCAVGLDHKFWGKYFYFYFIFQICCYFFFQILLLVSILR